VEFDFSTISAELRYKLLVGFVGPRPIALVTSRSAAGVDNAAPMSFFNVFAQTPPLLILGLQSRPVGSPKDTTQNILETGEFVVNLVDEAIARPMVVCAIEFPPEIDEVTTAGLSWLPSVTVAPGRIAQAPVAFECRLERVIEYPSRHIVFGEVAYMHVRDACIDPQTLRVRPEHYCPVARLHGDNYISAKDQYVLRKPSYEEWSTQVGQSLGRPQEAAFAGARAPESGGLHLADRPTTHEA
jgi:flavin reductase (DIM6/NTAB) family NADH-FMN oxidoreductase RutF